MAACIIGALFALAAGLALSSIIASIGQAARFIAGTITSEKELDQ